MYTVSNIDDASIGRYARTLIVAACAAFVAACASSEGGSVAIGSSGSSNDPVSPDFAIAYIKRTLPDRASKTVKPLADDLQLQCVWNGPAELWVRERASPSANETNVTPLIPRQASPATQLDIRDLDVSFDGKKLIFSARESESLERDACRLQAVDQKFTWTIWEYDLVAKSLRRVIADPIAAAEGHDVGPHYLPDGRIVFSSSRQRDAKAMLTDEGKSQFAAGIEGDRNLPAFVLHLMNPDGTGIHQLSYNTGHDLDPGVLNDGRILFTRWDINSGAGMQLYSINPDGSDLQLLYGRNSHDTGTPGSTVQFVQARARPDGKVVALLMPFQGTEFGGDPVLIDVNDFVEAGAVDAASGVILGPPQALIGATGAPPAQARLVVNDVRTTPLDPAAPAGTSPPVSPGGRFSSVFPLWDGTNRLLVSWSQCRLIDQALTVPCTNANLAKAGVVPAPTIYGIWIYDSATNTQLPIVAPVEGFMFTDVIAAQPRVATPAVPAIPDIVPGNPPSFTFTLAAQHAGILDIRSVYDFDSADTAPGGLGVVSDPTRRITDPQRPRPRFLRIEKAVSLPNRQKLSNAQLPDYAFGAAGNFMRELIGYAPIEPDGSVRVKIPANIPFEISVLDANGRRLDQSFPRHRNWLQLRTGETVTCNGCHVQAPGANGAPSKSHGRSNLFALLNTGVPVAGQPFPGTSLVVFDRTGAPVAPARQPSAGETMAEYRARMQVTCVDAACAAEPAFDIVSQDVWTVPGSATPDPAISWTYAQLLTPSPVTPTVCSTVWQYFCRVTIHYPPHIAALWTSARTTITQVNPATMVPYTACTDCHRRAVPAPQRGQLDLTSTPASEPAPCVAQLQYTSFCQLLFAHNYLDNNGQPVLVPGPPDAMGNPTQVPQQVVPPMSGVGANSSAAFFNKFAAGGSHAGWLTGAELKLVSEWLDLGAQYYNDPFAIPPAG